MKFDFNKLARETAVNEACYGSTEAADCTIDGLCLECQALATLVESALKRAFVAGQVSMLEGEGSEADYDDTP